MLFVATLILFALSSSSGFTKTPQNCSGSPIALFYSPYFVDSMLQYYKCKVLFNDLYWDDFTGYDEEKANKIFQDLEVIDGRLVIIAKHSKMVSLPKLKKIKGNEYPHYFFTYRNILQRSYKNRLDALQVSTGLNEKDGQNLEYVDLRALESVTGGNILVESNVLYGSHFYLSSILWNELMDVRYRYLRYRVVFKAPAKKLNLLNPGTPSDEIKPKRPPRCSNRCPVIGGKRRCWGPFAVHCQKGIGDRSDEQYEIKVCDHLILNNTMRRKYFNPIQKFGCTHVHGHLIINNVSKWMNLSFLSEVREISGKLVIILENPEIYITSTRIPLSKLRIIRGNPYPLKDDVFPWRMRKYSLVLDSKNEMVKVQRYFDLRNLRSIIKGNVLIRGAKKSLTYRYLTSIDWDDILENPSDQTVKIEEVHYPEIRVELLGMNSKEIVGVTCSEACERPGGIVRCWGPAASMCQKSSNCLRSSCYPRRCFEGGCCHHECVGGCVNHTAYGCFACRNSNLNGKCVRSCRKSVSTRVRNGHHESVIEKRDRYYAYRVDTLCLTECPKQFFVHAVGRTRNRTDNIWDCEKRCPSTYRKLVPSSMAKISNIILNSAHLNARGTCVPYLGITGRNKTDYILPMRKLEIAWKRKGNPFTYCDGDYEIYDYDPLGISDDRRLAEMKERYQNCTHVLGNLHIINFKHLEVDSLSFLNNIVDIDGSFIIYNNTFVETLRLENLRVIRGNSYPVEISKKCFDELHLPYFSFVMQSNVFKLEYNLLVQYHFPELSTLIQGNMLFNDTSMLYMNVLNLVDWKLFFEKPEIQRFITQPRKKMERRATFCPFLRRTCLMIPNRFIYPIPKNDDLCHRYKCPSSGRCFETSKANVLKLQHYCCDQACAGGCSGPTIEECFACKYGYVNRLCKVKPDDFYTHFIRRSKFASPILPKLHEDGKNPVCPERYHLHNLTCHTQCPAKRQRSFMSDFKCISCPKSICRKACRGSSPKGSTQSHPSSYSTEFPAPMSDPETILRCQYENCVVVENDLVLSGITQDIDLSFLSTIEEIKGKLIIVNNKVSMIPLYNLRKIATSTKYGYFRNGKPFTIFIGYNYAPDEKPAVIDLSNFTDYEPKHHKVFVAGNRGYCNILSPEFERKLEDDHKHFIEAPTKCEEINMKTKAPRWNAPELSLLYHKVLCDFVYEKDQLRDPKVCLGEDMPTMHSLIHTSSTRKGNSEALSRYLSQVYEGCEIVLENLVINNLEEKYFKYFRNIKEVQGAVIIFYDSTIKRYINIPKTLSLPNLRLIRGKQYFFLREAYSLYVKSSVIKLDVQLDGLKAIMSHNVYWNYFIATCPGNAEKIHQTFEHPFRQNIFPLYCRPKQRIDRCSIKCYSSLNKNRCYKSDNGTEQCCPEVCAGGCSMSKGKIKCNFCKYMQQGTMCIRKCPRYDRYKDVFKENQYQLGNACLTKCPYPFFPNDETKTCETRHYRHHGISMKNVKACPGFDFVDLAKIKPTMTKEDVMCYYGGCTHITGNLVIVNYTGKTDEEIDLRSIVEVSGVVFIKNVENLTRLHLENLQIVRANLSQVQLKKYPKATVFSVMIKTSINEASEIVLNLVDLRYVGSRPVGIFLSGQVCNVQTIPFMKMHENLSPDHSFYIAPYKKCVNKCSRKCSPFNHTRGSCWGSSEKQCLKIDTCDPSKCPHYQCYTKPNGTTGCCSELCIGCSGPTRKDCFGCRFVTDGTQCLRKCPGRYIIDNKSGMKLLNPHFRYKLGSLCVKECPENYELKSDECVAKKIHKDGKCEIPPVSNCTDKYEKCWKYSYNKCFAYHTWASENCARHCGFCGKCEDQSKNFLCGSKKICNPNDALDLQYCRKTCQFCDIRRRVKTMKVCQGDFLKPDFLKSAGRGNEYTIMNISKSSEKARLMDEQFSEIRYLDLKKRFSGCTHIDGYLLIGNIKSKPHFDFSFLSTIVWIRCSLLIFHSTYKTIQLQNLAVIKGECSWANGYAIYIESDEDDEMKDSFGVIDLSSLVYIGRGIVLLADFSTKTWPLVRSRFKNEAGALTNFSTVYWKALTSQSTKFLPHTYSKRLVYSNIDKCSSRCQKVGEYRRCWGPKVTQCQRFPCSQRKVSNCPKKPLCVLGERRECCNDLCVLECSKFKSEPPTCLYCKNFQSGNICKERCEKEEVIQGNRCLKSCPPRQFVVARKGTKNEVCTAENMEPLNFVFDKKAILKLLKEQAPIDPKKDKAEADALLHMRYKGYVMNLMSVSIGDHGVVCHMDFLTKEAIDTWKKKPNSPTYEQLFGPNRFAYIGHNGYNLKFIRTPRTIFQMIYNYQCRTVVGHLTVDDKSPTIPNEDETIRPSDFEKLNNVKIFNGVIHLDLIAYPNMTSRHLWFLNGLIKIISDEQDAGLTIKNSQGLESIEFRSLKMLSVQSVSITNNLRLCCCQTLSERTFRDVLKFEYRNNSQNCP